MRLFNLQMDLLRTFVTVVDLGGYTKAGHALGRTQPAVSLQMRRLEELVGKRLIAYEDRTAKLTADGEILLSFARQILKLNDEAAQHFLRTRGSSVARVGLPSDYAVNVLQGLVAQFARTHPEMQLEVRCDVSSRLHDMLCSDELDLAIAMVDRANAPHVRKMWSEQPVWAVSATDDVHTRNPVPLVAHPEGCRYRARMIKALDMAGRRWRIAFCSPDISDLQNAVRSGIGVSALTQGTLQPGMRVLGEADGFPQMAPIRMALCARPSRPNRPVGILGDYLYERLVEAGLCTPDEAIHTRRAG